ncbi:hypothetical protein F2Q68_00029453 [Brassica cretica]|nr:hypothetical protein F2Q68_00029453 [Brassica cretica]
MDRSIRQDRMRSFGWGHPSYLEDDADGITLRSWIAENPEALGDRVLEKWGCDLPFLFKIFEDFKWFNASYVPVFEGLQDSDRHIYYFSSHNDNGRRQIKFKNPKYLMRIEEAAHVPNVYHSYIKRWCKETGVCEPVTGNVQGTELPEQCDDDLLEKTK